MNIDTAQKSYGKQVLASDPYWGSYTGLLISTFNTIVGTRAKVQIDKCIEQPCQYAIVFYDVPYAREPYSSGEIKNFNLNNVQLSKGGLDLEDRLKNIVAVALEARLGKKVEISHGQWETAKHDALNDIYTNKFCFFHGISSDDFTNMMVSILVTMFPKDDAA
ncbi:MAG TPA: hypothetical protein VF941_00185 [Clostridia bacterium]